MNTAADDPAAFTNRAQGGGHELPHRCEDDCRIEFMPVGFIRAARLNAAQRTCEGLALHITRLCKGIDFPSLPQGDLRQDMCRGAETV